MEGVGDCYRGTKYRIIECSQTNYVVFGHVCQDYVNPP
jgi:hypothetical protein